LTYPTGVVVLTAGQVNRLLHVKTTTLRDWVARGHIHRRRRNAYDMGEILNYLDTRHASQSLTNDHRTATLSAGRSASP